MLKIRFNLNKVFSVKIKVSSEEDKKFEAHKRTRRVSECELVELGSGGEKDPIVEKLSKIGCLEKHYSVQECFFEHKDW